MDVDSICSSRGMLQGFFISSLLFIIAVEIIAFRIRQNDDISGINVKIDNNIHSLKISQLSDDTTLFLKSNDDIVKSFADIDKYGTF